VSSQGSCEIEIHATRSQGVTVMSSAMLNLAPINSWRGEIAGLQPALRRSVEDCAESFEIDRRDIRKQVLLHLPRFGADELQSANTVENETLRLATKLYHLRKGYTDWAKRPPLQILDRRTVEARPCDGGIAQEIYQRFHYIGSCRDAVFNIGLFAQQYPDVPFAVAALSAMDISQLRALAPNYANDSALVLSRVFAFAWAPKNSISFLLGAVHAWVRRSTPEIHHLVTYLNPNLEFTGSSYYAANWHPLLRTPLRYFYLNDNYITYRTFLTLDSRTQSSVTSSCYELEPLQILCYRVRASHGSR
jgi:hypothetical protein